MIRIRRGTRNPGPQTPKKSSPTLPLKSSEDQSTPWWGNFQLSYDLSAALGQTLGDSNGNNPAQGTYGPIFVVGENNGYPTSILNDFSPRGGWLLTSRPTDANHVYVLPHGVPEGGAPGVLLGLGMVGLMGGRRWFASKE
jgi:hypothetical protein